jgi:RNA polymerase sigma-70 factor (ECF subfamily)
MNSDRDGYYIKQALEGNTSGFAFLVEKYKDMVFTIAVRIAGNREDAEEIAQDVFVKAYQGLAGYKATSKFSTWLYSIAYNQSVSFIRKKHLNICSIDNFGTSIQETFGEDDSRLLLLDDIPPQYAAQALGKLDKTDQIILTLYYQNESMVKEIAKITGLTIANIKVRLFRGRKKLLAELQKIFKTEMVDLL